MAKKKKSLNTSVEKIKKEVKDIVNTDLVEDLIKNNVIEFQFNDISYRVKKPSFKEKQETNAKRIHKYTDLLKDENNLLEEDLIELYKKRNIDIKEMDKEYQILHNKRRDLLMKLGKAIRENQSKDTLEPFKNEIKQINDQLQNIALRKTVLLDSSIETQVNVFVYTYIAYLICEKLFDDKQWKKAWNTYDDFLNEDDALVNQVVWFSTIITKNEFDLL